MLPSEVPALKFHQGILLFSILRHHAQRQIQDFLKGGAGGLSRVWIFHTWTFCSETYHAVDRQNVDGQNTEGQNASENCKGGQNAGHFIGQGEQNANLIKTLYI